MKPDSGTNAEKSRTLPGAGPAFGARLLRARFGVRGPPDRGKSVLIYGLDSRAGAGFDCAVRRTADRRSPEPARNCSAHSQDLWTTRSDDQSDLHSEIKFSRRSRAISLSEADGGRFGPPSTSDRKTSSLLENLCVHLTNPCFARPLPWCSRSRISRLFAPTSKPEDLSLSSNARNAMETTAMGTPRWPSS